MAALHVQMSVLRDCISFANECLKGLHLRYKCCTCTQRNAILVRTSVSQATAFVAVFHLQINVFKELHLRLHCYTKCYFGTNGQAKSVSYREVVGWGRDPKKMYGERLGDGVEYHLMSPTPRR